MTHKRSENTSTVTRQRAKDQWVIDINGNKQRAVSWCTYYKKFFPLGEFYLKSASRRKHDNDVESVCCLAWDERVKKQELRAEKRRRRLEIARKRDKNFATIFDFERT